MGKKKDVNGFKYRRQGSIDDENFLMLGHGIGTIKEAVEDAKIDLTETNEQLAEIKNAVDNMEVSVELGDINVDLEETNSKLNDINISLQDYLTNLKKKLDDFDDSIEILNKDIEDINYNITQLDLYAKTLDSYITTIDNQITTIDNQITTINNQITTINTNLDNKAPKSHASSDTTYGVGTSSNYGHCRTINNLTTSSNTNGYTLSAYQGYLLNKNKANYIEVRYNDTPEFSINANEYTTFNQTVGVISGYTAIALLNYRIMNGTDGSGASWATIYSLYLSGTTVYFGVRNTRSSSELTNIKIRYWVLWQKND